MLLYLIVSISVLGYAASAAVVCSQYAKDVGGDGGLDSYYKRPIPGHCRAARLGNYRPTYRIVSHCIILKFTRDVNNAQDTVVPPNTAVLGTGEKPAVFRNGGIGRGGIGRDDCNSYFLSERTLE